MAIPENILKIQRPASTRVKYQNGHYNVIKRTSKLVIASNGKKRHVPVEIGKIGEIIDGSYVPIDNQTKFKLVPTQVDVKDYGNIALCYKYSKSILEDLKNIFVESDANKIYAIALLRSAYGNITNRDLKFRYETSFCSEYILNVALSKNTTSSFLDILGRNLNVLNMFMQKRLDSLSKDSIVAVDGMLKDYNSISSSYSLFSRKGRIKGSKDLSMLYAYDVINNEPLAFKVYPGNMLDCTSFVDFIETFKIKAGIIIADKGFKLDWIKDRILDNQNLTICIPIEKNLKIINELHLREYQGIFKFIDSSILYSVVETNGEYYYSFLNSDDFSTQLKGYLEKCYKNKTFDDSKYKKQISKLGNIVFKSNKKINPEDLYRTYDSRWIIEEGFDFYKNIIELEKERVQGDTRVIGNEFINYLSLLISTKTYNQIENKIKNKYSYSQILNYLSQIKKIRLLDGSNCWKETKTVKYIKDLATLLAI